MEKKIAEELLEKAKETYLHKKIMDISSKEIHYIYDIDIEKESDDDYKVMLYISTDKSKSIHYEDALRGCEFAE